MEITAMFLSIFFILTLGGAALASEPDRQLHIKRMGPFPRAGALDQKAIWCQNAIIIARGSYMPERGGFAMYDDSVLSAMRDRCVANGGEY